MSKDDLWLVEGFDPERPDELGAILVVGEETEDDREAIGELLGRAYGVYIVPTDGWVEQHYDGQTLTFTMHLASEPERVLARRQIELPPEDRARLSEAVGLVFAEEMPSLEALLETCDELGFDEEELGLFMFPPPPRLAYRALWRKPLLERWATLTAAEQNQPQVWIMTGVLPNQEDTPALIIVSELRLGKQADHLTAERVPAIDLQGSSSHGLGKIYNSTTKQARLLIEDLFSEDEEPLPEISFPIMAEEFNKLRDLVFLIHKDDLQED